MTCPAPKLLICLLLLLPSVAIPADEITKNDVIAHLIESYGGEQNLRKLDAIEQYWTMRSPLPNSNGHDYRKVLLPDHLLVELTYPNRTERRLITNRGAFNASTDGTFHAATDIQGDAMRLQLMRLYSPLTLRDRIHELVLRETDDLCVLSLASGAVQTDYLVSKNDWRIEKVAGTMKMDGGEMQFLTEYSDFRVVDGVLIAHRENKFAGDMNTATLELERARIGLDLAEKDFLVPNGI